MCVEISEQLEAGVREGKRRETVAVLEPELDSCIAKPTRARAKSAIVPGSGTPNCTALPNAGAPRIPPMRTVVMSGVELDTVRFPKKSPKLSLEVKLKQP